MYYVPASLSIDDSDREFIMNLISDVWSKEFYHNLDMNLSKHKHRIAFSPIGKKILRYLSRIGLQYTYQGFELFTCNLSTWYRGNPHVDIMTVRGNHCPIRSRLNIFIAGNRDDEMLWWDKVTYDNNTLVESKFPYDGEHYISRAVPGTNIDERWDYLGDPSDRALIYHHDVIFVRTDCAHTVHVSPGKRIILTVAFSETLGDISNRL